MHRALSGLACVLAFAAASFAATPSASALDCGTRLVVRGDRSSYVRSVCGEPQSATTRTETRTVGGYNQVPGGVIGGFNTVTVQIDTWIYDFGPSRFMEELIFENGVLTSSRPIGPGTPRRPLHRRASRKQSKRAASACRPAHES
jgi:hypothetical protein